MVIGKHMVHAMEDWSRRKLRSRRKHDGLYNQCPEPEWFQVPVGYKQDMHT